MNINIGKILKQRYEILQKVSTGATAQVYLSRDLKLKRNVILKIFNEEIFWNKKVEDIFINELKITSQLKHNNIVKLFDYFIFNDKWCLVLEYAEGNTLRLLLNNKEIFSEERVRHIFLQVMEALSFAWNKNIIHRDLKPENIIIDNTDHVKILDFGISIDRFFLKDIFKSGIVGSIKYLAPELIAKQETTNKTDIYAMGLIMYELLAGHLPFQSSDDRVIIQQHLYEKIVPIRQYNPTISQTMENIIIRATAKNTDERYQKASEIIKDLKKTRNFKNEKRLTLQNDTYVGAINIDLKLPKKTDKYYTFWLNKKFLFLSIAIGMVFIFIIIVLVILRVWA